jgi:BirA family biotin operon repressor/biotin-[acetyl-CoA-carboxylase] ligase
VLQPGNEYSGVAHGIDEQGNLLVETKDGEMNRVYAGEVSVRGIYGYV